jgi:26S proteasome regulatory subunit N6
MSLLKSNNELFSVIPKAKTAKIVRSILNIVGTIPDSLDIQISLSKDVVQWCIAEKRTFLRQRIEAKVRAMCFSSVQACVCARTESETVCAADSAILLY